MKHTQASLWIFLFSFLFLPKIIWSANERASTFELGKRQFESGNYERAVNLFAQAIERPADNAQKNRAYYYQGLALFEQGLYFSSYISFRNVLLSAEEKNRELYEKAIKNAAVITDRLDMVEKLGKVIERLPAGYIPSSVAGIAHYAQGVYSFSTGNSSAALSHFKSVSPDSQFYDKSLMYLGILSTKAKDNKKASF